MSTITEYQSLLLDFVPRPIRTEGEYRRTMRQIDRLMKTEKLSRAEGQLLELLATLAEQYESNEYPTPKVSQAELLSHLIDARGLTQAEVAREPDCHGRSSPTCSRDGVELAKRTLSVWQSSSTFLPPRSSSLPSEGLDVSDSCAANRDR